LSSSTSNSAINKHITSISNGVIRSYDELPTSPTEIVSVSQSSGRNNIDQGSNYRVLFEHNQPFSPLDTEQIIIFVHLPSKSNTTSNSKNTECSRKNIYRNISYPVVSYLPKGTPTYPCFLFQKKLNQCLGRNALIRTNWS